MDKWDHLKLWYKQPAQQWVEALPVGCGRLGAMVFGGVQTDHIQFNEDTLWTGKPHDYAHKGAVKYLSQIRQLLFDGQQKKAEDLAFKHFMSEPHRQKAYQPCGDLHLSFPGHENASRYRRELDLDTAIATTTYRVNGIVFKREVFASYPAQVIVIHLSASEPGHIAVHAALSSPHSQIHKRVVGDRHIALKGKIQNGAMTFETRLVAHTEGGHLVATAEGVDIHGADSATFILTVTTNFKSYRSLGADPAKRCDRVIKGVRQKSFALLKTEHITDHQSLFRRMSLDIGDPIDEPTDQRLKRLPRRDDPHLIGLCFQFGRYLLIASSRPGSQPANLQGIWNDRLLPPWDSKWTVNINTEMNYWPAESCNLSPCHEPLFDMLSDVAQTGQKVAKEHYGSRGWVLHHNTDLWRGAAPINASNHGIWPTGGAWLCQHLWWHYQYTLNKDFLRTRAYPIMKGAAEFFADTLILDPRTGKLISSPSNSPENGGLVAGPAMDHQIIRDLFSNCIAASRVLRVDTAFRKCLLALKKRITPNQIGRMGQLQEWLEDVDDPENKHRHVSHLWGLHPGCEITAEGTPELFEAAQKSLSFRGDEGTGWSMGWKINFYARFRHGDHALQMLCRQLKLVDGTQTSTRGGGGTYPNFFDAHPPFQIDGNFGATAGIAEMLLQNHTGEIHLLPALPSAWPSGMVEGLRARGGIELDITWQKGRLQQVIIYPTQNGNHTVRYGDKRITIKLKAKRAYILNQNLDIINA